MIKKNEILHVNTNFENSTIYLNMLNAFNSLEDISGKVYYPVEFTQKTEIDHPDIDIFNILKKTDRYFYFYRNKKLFKNMENHYDFKRFKSVLAYSLFSNGYLAYTIMKKYGIPYNVIVQNTDVNLYYKKMLHLRSIANKILKNANSVIFISEPYRQKVLERYVNKKDRYLIENKSYVIPFGIDDYWLQNRNKNYKKDFSHNDIRLLYIGKINKNKNILTTAKSCEALINRGYTVSLTVVGNVEDLTVYKKLKKYSFIKFIPFQSKEDLISIYRKHDIFVMPSKKESFGLVYAEALTQGLPIIYSKQQGFDGHFEDGLVGYAVNPMDHQEITDKILKIRKNFSSIQERCIELSSKFCWNTIAEHYCKVLF